MADLDKIQVNGTVYDIASSASYSAGDKYPSSSTYLVKAGHITSGSKRIQFSSEFPKSLKNISSVTFNGSWVARSLNGYIESASYDKTFSDDVYGLAVSKTDETVFCYIYRLDGAAFKYTNDTVVTNNSIVEIVLNGQFVFS